MVGDERGGKELLFQAAFWVGVDAHATLLLHDVPFLVELAGDGVADATALHVGPEFEAVGGHAEEVLGGVLGSRGVEAHRAVLLGQFGELIGDDVLLGLGLRVLERLLERGQLCRVLPDALAELGVVRGVGRFDLGQGDFLSGVVGGADGVGPLEGDVLEHVGEAALALGIVDRTGVDQRVEAEYWGLWTLVDDES